MENADYQNFLVFITVEIGYLGCMHLTCIVFMIKTGCGMQMTSSDPDIEPIPRSVVHYQWHAITWECKNWSRKVLLTHTVLQCWYRCMRNLHWIIDDQFFLYIDLIANQWNITYQINEEWWLVLPMKLAGLDGNAFTLQRCLFCFWRCTTMNSINWNAVFDAL